MSGAGDTCKSPNGLTEKCVEFASAVYVGWAVAVGAYSTITVLEKSRRKCAKLTYSNLATSDYQLGKPQQSV